MGSQGKMKKLKKHGIIKDNSLLSGKSTHMSKLVTVNKIPEPNRNWPIELCEIWKKTCRELLVRGILFTKDLPALKEYCFGCYQYRVAERKLLTDGFVVSYTDKDGNTFQDVSPWLSVKSRSLDIIYIYSSKFGFTPGDRENHRGRIQKIRNDMLSSN